VCGLKKDLAAGFFYFDFSKGERRGEERRGEERCIQKQ
jgi:hypothetical protein